MEMVIVEIASCIIGLAFDGTVGYGAKKIFNCINITHAKSRAKQGILKILSKPSYESYLSVLKKYFTEDSTAIKELSQKFADAENVTVSDEIEPLVTRLHTYSVEQKAEIPIQKCRNLYSEIYNVMKNLFSFLPSETKILRGVKELNNQQTEDIIERIKSKPTNQPKASGVTSEKEIEEFIAEYDEPLYLEEDVPQPFSLRDLYIVPDCRYYNKNCQKDDKYVNNSNNALYEMEQTQKLFLIISGEPAVGKSSLVKHYLKSRTPEQLQNIIFARFNRLEAGDNIKDSLDKLCPNTDFRGKTILLDGCDEYALRGNCSGEEQLTGFIHSVIDERNTTWKNCHFIITTRKNCVIHPIDNVNVRYIELKLFSPKQIDEYAAHFSKAFDHALSDKIGDVIGIPMILYMICRLDYRLDKSSSRAKIYDDIFSLDGKLMKSAHNGEQHSLLKNETDRTQLCRLYSM